MKNNAPFRRKATTLCVAASMALLLAACGGGGDDAARIVPPSAQVVGPDLQQGPDGLPAAEVGKTVVFTSTASSPRAGAVLSYAWTLVEKPAGSQAVLVDADKASVSLTPDRVGRYVVSLVVGDGESQSSAAQATIAAISLDPIAVVADGFVVPVAAAPMFPWEPATLNVQLDGSKSSVPTGGDPAKLRYHWQLTSVPAGSTAVLDDATSPYPRFSAGVEGNYRASLQVSYGDRQSKNVAEISVDAQKTNLPATIKVKINGQDTGTTLIKVNRNQPIEIDASETFDPDSPDDKSKLQFRWSWNFDAPYGQTPLPTNVGAKLNWTLQRVGSINGLRLTVFDGTSYSTRDIGFQVVNPEGAEPLAPVIQVPFRRYGTQTYEAEAGSPHQLANATAYSLDMMSDYRAITYKWKWISYPTGWNPDNLEHFNPTPKDTWGFTDPTASNASFTSLPIRQAGVTQDYVVELQACRVDLPALCSAPARQTYTARLGANRAPVAEPALATGNSTVGIGVKVMLDGSASSDPDNNVLTYKWTLEAKPDGSNATFDDASSVRPSFVSDKAGAYVVTLQVTDSNGFASEPTYSARRTIYAKDKNHKPSLRLSLDRAYTRQQPLLVERFGDFALENSSMSWTGSIQQWNSFYIRANGLDPDNDPLTYLWSIKDEPLGNVAYMGIVSNGEVCANGDNYNNARGVVENLTPLAYYEDKLKLRSWTCADVGMAPSKPGDYTFSVSAYDGSELVGPYVVTVPTADRAGYPGLLLESTLSQTGWDNEKQGYVFRTDSKHATQEFFPFVLDGYRAAITDWGQTLADSFGTGDYVARTYRLTAGDRDYTIANLKAVDGDGVYQPRFDGLSDGQVIKKGATVEFKLVLPIVKPLEKDENGYALQKQAFEWSFSTLENPDFSFRYTPWLFRN